MSKPFCVWKNYDGDYKCGSRQRFTPQVIVAEFDSYQRGAEYARQANIDEAERQRVAKQQRAIAESKQGELAI
jgi:hypothetical protein